MAELTPIREYDNGYESLLRLVAGSKSAAARIASRLTAPPGNFNSSAETPPSGGGSSPQAFEIWTWLLPADKAAGTPWTVTSASTGTGVLRGLTMNLSQFSGIAVDVGPHADLPQGTGIEAYAHWEWDSATQITIYNLSAFTSSGAFPGHLVRIRAFQ